MVHVGKTYHPMLKEKSFQAVSVAVQLSGIQTSRNAHDLSIPNGIDQVAQHLWVTFRKVGGDGDIAQTPHTHTQKNSG